MPDWRGVKANVTDAVRSAAPSVPGILDGYHDRTGGIDRNLAVRFHLRRDFLRLVQERLNNLVFRHGFDHLALDEDLALAI